MPKKKEDLMLDFLAFCFTSDEFYKLYYFSINFCAFIIAIFIYLLFLFLSSNNKQKTRPGETGHLDKLKQVRWEILFTRNLNVLEGVGIS